MINKQVLIGNLGKDPEVRRLENGTAVATFSVATSESYKDKNGEWQTATEWHNVVVWRELAERAEKTLKKGMTVYIEGKTTHRKYTDKDNNERTITEVVASTARSLEKKQDSTSPAPAPTERPAPTANTAQRQTECPFQAPPAGYVEPETDLPF